MSHVGLTSFDIPYSTFDIPYSTFDIQSIALSVNIFSDWALRQAQGPGLKPNRGEISGAEGTPAHLDLSHCPRSRRTITADLRSRNLTSSHNATAVPELVEGRSAPKSHLLTRSRFQRDVRRQDPALPRRV
jgi:hypothetical protein